MAYWGGSGPPVQVPVYQVGMQPGHNAVYPAPVIHRAAAPLPPPPPGTSPACPPGLEYLGQIDHLLVHQRVEVSEMVLGWEANNVYTIRNTLSQQMFVATEENNIFTMQVCGSTRPFIIHIHDNLGREALTLRRPLRCSLCCFPCCLQELEVQSPLGTPVGYVEQTWHPVLPRFTILDASREPQLRIRGPCCPCSCGSDVTFQVTLVDESTVVGQISKQWGGIFQEGFTDADNFAIEFPIDLDVRMKAVILGACFLIDFMFFETKPNRDR